MTKNDVFRGQKFRKIPKWTLSLFPRFITNPSPTHRSKWNSLTRKLNQRQFKSRFYLHYLYKLEMINYIHKNWSQAWLEFLFWLNASCNSSSELRSVVKIFIGATTCSRRLCFKAVLCSCLLYNNYIITV